LNAVKEVSPLPSCRLIHYYSSAYSGLLLPSFCVLPSLLITICVAAVLFCRVRYYTGYFDYSAACCWLQFWITLPFTFAGTCRLRCRCLRWLLFGAPLLCYRADRMLSYSITSPVLYIRRSLMVTFIVYNYLYYRLAHSLQPRGVTGFVPF
jgi:hypothetical protein